MNGFDKLFYSVFVFYKKRYKQKASTIAITYISVLQCLLLLLFGVFSAKFISQMHVDSMSSGNAWTLFVLASFFICFKNWMQYTGKRRMMINAKMLKKKSNTYNIYLLWLLPIATLGLAYVLFQAI